MPWRGLGDRVILHAVRVHDALLQDALEAAGPFRLVPQQFVGPQLIDDDQDDQAGDGVRGGNGGAVDREERERAGEERSSRSVHCRKLPRPGLDDIPRLATAG